MAPSSNEIKLLGVKAKNFASNLYGVKNLRLLVAEGSALKWHKTALQQLKELKGVPEDKLLGPYSKTDAMEWVASKLKVRKGSVANILFEDYILISFEVDDPEEFILCAYHASATMGSDLALIFLNPDVVILVHDAATELSIYQATRQALYR